jgi:hypothetical protein
MRKPSGWIPPSSTGSRRAVLLSALPKVNQGIQNFYLAKLFATNGQPEKALTYLLKALGDRVQRL